MSVEIFVELKLVIHLSRIVMITGKTMREKTVFQRIQKEDFSNLFCDNS